VQRSGALFDFGEAKDRALEAFGRLVGKGIWSEMRENAAAGALPDAGTAQQQTHLLVLLALQLQALSAALQKSGSTLELHLVGHSAGSILLGHLLGTLASMPPGPMRPQAASCTLFAAACSVRFAVDHYLPAAEQGVLRLDKLWLYHLSDDNERGDGLPSAGHPVYGKSLLYLVSRALDDSRKTPLLGMERALLPAYASDQSDQWDAGERPFLRTWQAAWSPPDGKLETTTVREPKLRQTRVGDQTPATHGSFDNNIEVLSQTLARIKGAALLGEIEWLDY
jgi:hypothetical protein